MKPLAKALRELARILERAVQRLRLVFDRRKLARLEISLGLLAWQQAEYDEATQAHVDRLTDYERAQLRLTNEAAQLAIEIQKIEEQRGVGEREWAEAQAVALEKEHSTATTPEQLAEQIAEQRRTRKEIEARLPVLDRELALAEKEYRALVLPSAPSPELKAELQRLRKVILALPREKTEWQARLQQSEVQIASMNTLHDALREARTNFEKRDRELAADIEARRRAKRQLEKESESLEKVKSDPYREIGRVLADHKVAPLNQPDALAAVMEQRRMIAAREAGIATSLAESAQDGWATSRRS